VCVLHLLSQDHGRCDQGNAAELLLTMLHFFHCQHTNFHQQILLYSRYRRRKQPIPLANTVCLYVLFLVSLLVVAAQILNVDIPLKRRDPHYFLPTTGEGSQHTVMLLHGPPAVLQ